MTRTTVRRAVLCALVSTGCSSTNAAEKASRNAAASKNEIPAPAPADLKRARVGFMVFPNLLGSIDSILKLLGPPLAIGLTSQGLLRSLLQGSQTPESFIASVAFHRPIAILLLRDDALAGQKPALLRIELRDVELFRQSLSQLAQVHERTPWGTDIYQMSDGPLHVAIRDRVAYAGSSAELVAADRKSVV